MGRIRMNHDERHCHIIKSTAKLLAFHSPETLTTRRIAKSAGVSEALLYRHFPCKDDIYSAVVNHYFVDIDFVCKQLQAVPTTTDSLMFLVYSVFALACESFGRTPEDTRLVRGLVFRSIISDGKYARRIFSAYEPVQEKMIRCFEEAQKRGKIVVPQDNSWMLFWFCHHLALYLGLLLKAESQIIDYRQGGRRIHLEAVGFCLRGIGVKESLLSKIKLESYSAKLEYLMSDLSSGPYRGQP